jgi:hypothetical protein
MHLDPAPRPIERTYELLFEFHYLRMLQTALAERRAYNAPQAVRSYWQAYRRPRLIDGNGIAMHLDPAPRPIERTYELLFELLSAYQRVCAARGIQFMVAIHSQRYQIQPGDLEAAMKVYRVRRSHFDLMQPNELIAAHCEREGIPCLDPTQAMAATHEQKGEQLFMPHGDMHWNARGARAYFEGLKDQLRPELEQLGGE